MELLGEKIIKLQDSKYKIQQNNSNEASIFISGSLAERLNIVPGSTITFKINKEDVIKLLCFTFSFKKPIYKKQDKIHLDLIWFQKMLTLINNHFQVTSNFVFDVKKQSQDRYYFIALEQSNGLNIRDLFIQDHIKLQFFKEKNLIGENLIEIECSDIAYAEDSRTELSSESNIILQETVLRQFALKSFKYMVNEYGVDFLINSQSNITESETDGEKYKTYLFPKYFTQGLLYSFEKEPQKNENRTSPRFINENLNILENNYIYISTEWAYSGTSNLLFSQLVRFIESYSNNKYTAIGDGGINPYKLIMRNVGSLNISFDFKSFHQKTKDAGLIFSEKMVARFVASLCTKPFVICSGLSGSGKTKLAQSFVQWISESDQQYKIVPVGADWTNREPLLGYPNALKATEYISPDNGILDLILQASHNKNLPYFLILDEMNLSHVERYFADFLSTMESKDAIPLHADNLDGVSTRFDSKGDSIQNKINLPSNLFIIGTVNIDETTYMFSPKVLDRANAIEFRITDKEIENYLNDPGILDMNKFVNPNTKMGFGAPLASKFLNLAEEPATSNKASTALVIFFKELKKAGAEFGYRSASEINRLVAILETLTTKDTQWDNEMVEDNDFIDIAIMQKLLPKLHGSRNKLAKVLPVLGSFCLVKNAEKIKEDYLDKFANNTFTEEELKNDKNIKYPISFEKICRMYKNALEHGFASYAEA